MINEASFDNSFVYNITFQHVELSGTQISLNSYIEKKGLAGRFSSRSFLLRWDMIVGKLVMQLEVILMLLLFHIF